MTAYISGLVVRTAGAPPAVEDLRLPEVGPGQGSIEADLVQLAGVVWVSDRDAVGGHAYNVCLRITN